MNNRLILFAISLVLTTYLSEINMIYAHTLPNSRPNVILIFIDDMGYGDLGCFGSTDYVTPNIDKLASDGMRFTHFYAVQAVCSASRAGLLTGCYPNRIGITGALRPNQNIGINQNETTIAEMLKQVGYNTAIFGKWHLGDSKQFLPLQQGFDEYTGLPYSNDMWPVNYDGKTLPDGHRKWKHPPLPLIEGNRIIDTINTLEEQAELTTLFTHKAVDFIERQNRETPFFLYLPHPMVHVPIGASPKFKGKSEQGLFGDVVMEIDWSVQQIMKSLEKKGIVENTLVIFTSDNGPWLNYGNHAGTTGGLREGKGTSFEGGQRVPCIMHWPEYISAGKVCNKLSCTIDILPTLAALSGASLPKLKIDGVSILPLLEGDENANPRETLYYYYRKNNLEAVRHGKWKLVFPHTHRSYIGVTPGNDGWPGKYAAGKTELALYNLRRDPGERYDVKEIYPKVVEELQLLAEKAREDLGDNLTDISGENRREPGSINK